MVEAAAQDEFVSDAYNLEISDEDLLKEMEALRASPSGDGEGMTPNDPHDLWMIQSNPSLTQK